MIQDPFIHTLEGGASVMRVSNPATESTRGPQDRPALRLVGKLAARDDPRTALLAAEAVSFVIRRLPTHQSTRQLKRIATHDPGLLAAAASRCEHITAVEEDIRAGAVQLLERAASEIRVDRRQGETTIRI